MSKRSNHSGILNLYENNILKRSVKIFRNKVYTCGRDIDCSIPIQGDQYISSTHFKFWCTQFDSTYDPIVYVQDMSLNGTICVYEKTQSMIKIKNREIFVVKNGTCLYFPHEVHALDSINNSVMKFKFVIEKKKIPNIENDDEQRRLLDLIEKEGIDKNRWVFNNTFFGSGSFGVVSGCLDMQNKKKLTVCKIIKDTIMPLNNVDLQEFSIVYKKKYGKSPLMYSKVKKEKFIMQNLDHPNVVKYISDYTTAGTEKTTLDNGMVFMKSNFLIFQEQAHGGDLFSYLLDPKTLVLRTIPEAECLLIIYQIMLALEYLHSLNLAHRDLKLDNILLERPEKLSRIMLTDFGIAKQKSLRMKTCIGTPEYSAPEVGNFHKNTMRDVIQSKVSKNEIGYEKKCDIWSLGIIFYYLLTGEPFFEKKYEENIMKRFEKYSVDDLQTWVNGRLNKMKELYVSDECISFVKHLLTIDEEQRYDITECFEDEYISGHKSSLDNIYKGIIQSSQYEGDSTNECNKKKRKL